MPSRSTTPAARGSIKEPRPDGGGRVVFTPERSGASLFSWRPAFLFHFANAAMLPPTGRDAIEGQPEKQAAPFMSAWHHRDAACDSGHCGVDWKTSCCKGTKITFASRLRCPSHTRSAFIPLHTLAGALIAIQTLDGIANAIFGIVSILVVKDRTQGEQAASNIAAGVACDDGWDRGRCEHNIRWPVDPASRVPSVFSGLSGNRLSCFLHCYGSPVPETLSSAGAATLTSGPEIKSTTDKEAFAQ